MVGKTQVSVSALPQSAAVCHLQNLEQMPERGRIEHTGYIQSVTHVPPGEAPRLTATVVDQLARPGVRRRTAPHVRLLFMGQKRVPGIKPGVKIRYSGMLSLVDQVPTVHNPRYLILPQERPQA
ncbi:hypothetical protein [Glutamicibacter creatinolyticus]|uniref:hypothetical protein n=1 Tax=Glutamicibacter creatinolyticus TaxID=162496 RepID=UPI0031D30A2F